MAAVPLAGVRKLIRGEAGLSAGGTTLEVGRASAAWSWSGSEADRPDASEADWTGEPARHRLDLTPMARALKVCSTTGCPELVPKGRCAKCDREADQARGSAADRGYDHRWSRTTRRSYLRRYPFCVLRLPGCTGLAEVPDHWPVDRRELLRLGVPDPDADHRLRPLCQRCHRVRTAHDQPGGWHAG